MIESVAKPTRKWISARETHLKLPCCARMSKKLVLSSLLLWIKWSNSCSRCTAQSRLRRLLHQLGAFQLSQWSPSAPSATRESTLFRRCTTVYYRACRNSNTCTLPGANVSNTQLANTTDISDPHQTRFPHLQVRRALVYSGPGWQSMR